MRLVGENREPGPGPWKDAAALEARAVALGAGEPGDRETRVSPGSIPY
jgi:hypothetical protein